MNGHSLFTLANQATDRHRFLLFLDALRKDCINNREQWENVTIADYFESIGAWMEAYHGDAIDFEKPDWKTIAALFYMGKVYE